MIEEDSNKITLLLKNSEWGLVEKKVYTPTHDEMMENLRKTGELDFSHMDKEWEKLLLQYPAEQTEENKNE